MSIIDLQGEPTLFICYNDPVKEILLLGFHSGVGPNSSTLS